MWLGLPGLVLYSVYRSHRICSSRPGEVGNSTGRVRRDPRGRVPGVSTDFNPGTSPAAWFSGRSKVSHCAPGQGQCWRPCQRPPRAGGILARRRGLLPPAGHCVRCGTLACPGGYPYCWCEIFKVQSLAAVLLLYRTPIRLYVAYWSHSGPCSHILSHCFFK